MAHLAGGALLRIPSFFEWFDGVQPDGPWLVLGKGPSFAERHAHDLAAYHLLTLNDAIVHVPHADVAHFVDWEAFTRCEEAVRASGCVVAMPWHPHVEFRPAEKPLPDLLSWGGPEAQTLAPRVVYYHAATARGRGRIPGEPLVPVKFFSAEAAIGLLALAGVKTIRTLGVDGGTAYAPEFEAAGLTPLENGGRSFDAQFARMRETARRHCVDLRALGAADRKVKG